MKQTKIVIECNVCGSKLHITLNDCTKELLIGVEPCIKCIRNAEKNWKLARIGKGCDC